jgi:TatD DNase family protein
MVFDVHCHPTDPDTAPFEEVLERARNAGVTALLATGYDPESNLGVLRLAARYAGVAAAVGFHPWFLRTDLDLEGLRKQAANPAVVALGEIGLDGKIEAPQNVQERWFLDQLRLAVELDLPVVVHSRAAFEHTLECLRRVPGSRGILHSFGGSPELARELVERGFLVSFSGSVTRPGAKRIHRLARALPPEALLVETDAPSIGAEGIPPGTIEPCHLPRIVAALAALREEATESVAATTTANAFRLLDGNGRLAAALALQAVKRG